MSKNKKENLRFYKKVDVNDVVDSPDDRAEGDRHMRAFMNSAFTGEQPPSETMLFLADAFKHIILQGADPKKALKITTKQGVKSSHAVAHRHTLEIRNAVMVEEFILQGKTKDEARQEVCNYTGLKYRAIRDQHKKYQILAKEHIKIYKKFEELKEGRAKK